jgi:hypothetical protein
MSLSRIAWLITVGLCLLIAVILFLSSYSGYGLVAIAVGLAAALNLTGDG